MDTGSLPHHPTFPLYSLARRLWPGLDSMPADRRLIAAGEVVTCIYAAPLAAIGIAWLIRSTDLSIAAANADLLILQGVLILALERLSYFLLFEIREARFGSTDGSLEGVVFWTGLFLLGPTGIWPMVLLRLIRFLGEWLDADSAARRWTSARSFVLNLGDWTLASLVALQLYYRLGGMLPLSELSAASVLPALAAIVVAFVLRLAIWSGYIGYILWTQRLLAETRELWPALRFSLVSLGLPTIANPFAVLQAVLYVTGGLAAYSYLAAGLLLVSYLARQLSWTAESSRQQARVLEKLEALGRDLINSPFQGLSLPGILQQHLPGMFPPGHLRIWTFDGEILFEQDRDWPPVTAKLESWLSGQREVVALLEGESRPWDHPGAPGRAALIGPILDAKSGEPIGGIQLELRPLFQAWNRRSLEALAPAVTSLADQISSAFDRGAMYERALELQRVTRELELAGQIQASFLPFNVPRIPGWQIAVTLDPLEETSGDFFDLIPLSENRLGLVIADVAHKGIGPALYMSISRTLIRTFAIEFDSTPDLVFYATNERILADTSADLFVTAFYGVLDLDSGELTYCNAGHNPPLLLRAGPSQEHLTLARTGMPIGIEAQTTWELERVEVLPGDVLVLYTDGIPEARSPMDQLFGEQRLANEARRSMAGKSAEGLQRALLNSVYAFIGDGSRNDDITLIVLIRD